MGRRVRVLIADDHALIVEAFRRLLEPKFDVIDVASDGRELLQLALKTKPDVILLDLGMPNLNGFAAGQQVKKLLPTTKIVVVTMNEDAYMVDAVLRCWASGYITKNSAGSELLNAINAVMNGKRYIVRKIAQRQSERFIENPHCSQPHPLTFREREVLLLFAGGLSMKQVAAELHLSARTIAFHKYKIMNRYSLKSNYTFLRFAIQQQVVARPETACERPSAEKKNPTDATEAPKLRNCSYVLRHG